MIVNYWQVNYTIFIGINMFKNIKNKMCFILSPIIIKTLVLNEKKRDVIF